MIKKVFISILILSSSILFGQGTKITLSLKQESIISLLDTLSTLSKHSFAYNPKKIDIEKKINFQVQGVSLEKCLEIFSQENQLEYSLIGTQIILKARKEYMTISGFVKDLNTGESLPGATIYIPSLEQGTICNSSGFYSLSLPLDQYSTTYSYIGYLPHIQDIEALKKVNKSVKLKTNHQLLDAIVIKSIPTQNKLSHIQIGQVQINPQILKSIPHYGGETDLVKSMQSIPGIQIHSEGSALFYVRGGNRDQNLIMIDGSPIYNPAHLFGFYSVIVPDVIKGMNIYKSDFPVETETRLSSIIDLQTKEGNYKNIEIHGVLNPLTYRFSVEAPIIKDKSSFFTSFRHSNFRWIFQNKSPNAQIYFYDFNTKMNFALTKNDRIYFSIFTGKDLISEIQGNGIQWDNTALSFRWDHIFNKKLFFRMVSNTGKYLYQLTGGDNTWSSGIQSAKGKGILNYYPNPNLQINGGYSFSYHHLTPGNLYLTESESFFPSVSPMNTREHAFFASSKYQLSKKLQFNAGLRIPIWQNFGETKYYSFNNQHQVTDTILTEAKNTYHAYVHFDPRISIKYLYSKRSSFQLSYGFYHQYINQITNTTSPFTALEIWLPAGPNIQAQSSTQLTTSWNYYLADQTIRFSSELYYKKLYHQILYKEHADLLLNPLIEGELRIGNGTSYGLELTLQKEEGKFNGWIAYTYSHSKLKSPELNQGKEFSPFYDRPHDFSAFLQWQFHRKLSLSTTFVYYTGSAITTPIGFYEYLGQQIPIYGDKNNDRLPDYHRLDVALQWRIDKGKHKFQHSLTLSVANVYNHANPISINYNKVKTKNGKYVVPSDYYQGNQYTTTQISLLGIMPSITYKFAIK